MNDKWDGRLNNSNNIAMKYVNRGHKTFYQNEKWDEWVEKIIDVN